MRMNCANSRGLKRPKPSAILAGGETGRAANLIAKLRVLENRSSLGEGEDGVPKVPCQLPHGQVLGPCRTPAIRHDEHAKCPSKIASTTTPTDS